MNDTKPQGFFTYHSLFWPVMLIGVGVTWLLSSLGIIAPVSWGGLLRLWPLLLIAIGLDILFGRRVPVIGAFIALGTIAVVAALLIALPSVVANTSPTIKHDTFSEPLGNATAAKIDLSLSTMSTTINALEDSDKLISANLDYVGEIDFTAQGYQEKDIHLSHNAPMGTWFMPPGHDHWDIGLSPRVPLDLKVDASTGLSELNLGTLKLNSLTIDASTGSMTIDLPAAQKIYDMTVNGSTGSIIMEIPRGAQLNMRLKLSTGSVTIHVQPDAGVQLRVEDDGLGSVSMRSNYTRTQQGEGKRGTWESPNYASAERKITIIVEKMSTGSLTVR
jgi:hypothetical protein